MFCPYEVRYFNFPISFTSSAWTPWIPRSKSACSPASRVGSPPPPATLSALPPADQPPPHIPGRKRPRPPTRLRGVEAAAHKAPPRQLSKLLLRRFLLE